MISTEGALDALRSRGAVGKAADMAAYHKAPRVYLGVSNPDIDACCRDWRAGASLADRLALAKGLWESDVHEARVAAAKLLTQARIADDGPVWDLIRSWVPDFDAWAIADHAAGAGARRLSAAPERLDEVEVWTRDENFWVRRAALVFTLPWAKGRHLKPEDVARRERVLGWAAGYVADREWFIQKSVSWWLRTLSKHDPDRVRAFLAEHGATMKAFARRDAGKYLN